MRAKLTENVVQCFPRGLDMHCALPSRGRSECPTPYRISVHTEYLHGYVHYTNVISSVGYGVCSVRVELAM